MALPDVTKQRARQRLATFCESRIPAHVRHQLRLKYATRGDTVTLFEERPSFRDRTRWVRLQVAQFRFDTDRLKWSLYWPDRNRRWHLYDGVRPSHDLDDLLTAIDRDRSGVFWG